MTTDRKDTKAPWWAVMFGVVAVVGLTAVYFILRDPTLVHHLSWHAELATALGPVTGILSLFAVVAALWSVELQRRAMKGQQDEIDRHMRLLEEQREQFARSAGAQEALATSQSESAKAQKEANYQSEALRLAQHSNTIAILVSASTRVAFEMARLRATSVGTQQAMQPVVDELLKKIDSRLEPEQVWEEQLRKQVATRGSNA